MKSNRIFKRILASLMLAASFLMQASEAADIDIFVGASGGTAAAPNVIFLVDNSPNWSREAQKWPDNGGNQGQAELAAITSILNTINTNTPMNIGYATLTAYAGSSSGGNTPGDGGGYIRFGVRDMSVAANRTALQNILTGINNNITDPNEKVNGTANKDEAAGFYEIYKYLSGLAPFSGTPAQNVKADTSGNGSSYTASQQGLSSGFAYKSNGNYNSPITTNNPCAKTFIIYIANNSNNYGSKGQASYQPSVITAGTALSATSGADTWTDEWTKLLYTNGVVVPEGNNNGSVVTYILDAYNAQQDSGYSNSLMNAAKVGGGRYFQVGNQAAILTALSTIFAEIQGVNSTFASASLPVNTTNRAQDKNQVFIPMFRPDANGAPRWMGNLKQYQFISNTNSVDLGDMNGNVAVNPLTGFPNDCANSFWTTDSGSYWSIVGGQPSRKGNCATSSNNAFSDAPDGPFVEKGGVAEVIRKGNNPQITNNTPTWAVNRTVYTLSGSSLTAFTSASSGLSSSVTNFILGYDVSDENGNGDVTETRPSLHGDTIHSRPVPVDYGGTTGVTVYYGSNDGNLRAVDTATGKERWSFIAPEFFGTLSRLVTNSPLVSYPSMPTGITPTPTAKDYYFDGTIGLYQNADNSKVWIYPTMRRGGRMIYAFDVTNPASPVFKWKVGCPNLANDTGCTAGMSGVGQTWSIPNVAAKVLGYSGPVIVVGGGYDNCDDANTSTPSCASGKGGIVYVLDAFSGAVIRSFTTLRAVAADVALIGVANPGTVDYGYIADLGGNIYRLDFAASSANWAMNRIAYTNGAGRKFFYAPSLLPAPGNKMYLALGSGDREHPLQSQYPYGNVINRLYVILDDLAGTSATNLDSTTSMKNFTSNTTCTTAGVLPTSSEKGWFMDLNQYGTGEQTVTSAAIIGGMIVLSTNRPVPAAEGSCNTSLGEARGYWLNLFNASGAIGVAEACGGTRSTTFVGGGLPPSPVFGVVSINGSPKSVIIGAVEKSGGASSAISPQQVKPPIRMNRKTIYWKSSGNN